MKIHSGIFGDEAEEFIEGTAEEKRRRGPAGRDGFRGTGRGGDGRAGGGKLVRSAAARLKGKTAPREIGD